LPALAHFLLILLRPTFSLQDNRRLRHAGKNSRKKNAMLMSLNRSHAGYSWNAAKRKKEMAKKAIMTWIGKKSALELS
jgi:hypothetical protein